jgi:hypothetical protein
MRPTPGQIQKALDFLVWLRSADDRAAAIEELPASVDYEALAALAPRADYDVTAPAVAEAFRMVMRARAFAMSRAGKA